jgi:TRAP-type mannitol/chloroaromatic compound transport system permease large subunit
MHFADLSLPLVPSAFYLKTAAPPHITFEQICVASVPYLAITVLALILPLIFSELSLWLSAQMV